MIYIVKVKICMSAAGRFGQPGGLVLLTLEIVQSIEVNLKVALIDDVQGVHLRCTDGRQPLC